MPILKAYPEFLVNTTTTDAQSESRTTLLEDGRFVVTWMDFSQRSTTGSDIRARIFNPDGTEAVAEILVNTTILSNQSESRITTLTDGRFVVTYTDASQSGTATGFDIRARIFNADGSQSVAEFVVNTTTLSAQNDSSVTALTGGRFVVTWTDSSAGNGDTSGTAIRARIVNADGSPSPTEFLVNSTVANDQRDSSVTTLSDGRFIVTWTNSVPGTVNGSDIFARIFNADGSQSVAEFVVNATTADLQFDSSVTPLSDGRFVVSWTDSGMTGGDRSANAVRARVFNADGSQFAPEFLVNTQTGFSQDKSSASTLADGRFVVTWADQSGGNGDISGGISAGIFNADGSKAVPDFLVNTTTQSSQILSNVTILQDGRFIVTWTDNSQSGGDTSGTAIRAQVFDPTIFDGTSVGDTVTGGSLGDRYSGLDGNDAMDGRAGNDTLDGGAGNDFLTGGAGNDSLNGGADFDYANYLDASSTAGVTVSLAVTTAQNTGGAGTDTLTAIEGIYGSNFGDTLTGDNAPVNALYGWGGADSIVGNGGFDYIEAGEADDTLDGGAGDDFLLGGNGIDTLTYASAGAAVYVDMSGASAFANGTASGFDVLSGVERVIGSGFGDFLFGSAGADTLTGGVGIDILYGFGLGDSLDGGDDTDYIVGGAGADTITSGAGQDYIYFQGQTEGKDTITDWRANGFDLICIDEPAFGAGLTVNQYLSDAGNANRFVVGTVATAAIGQFLWNSATSTLSWDADGTGAGAAVQLVTLTGITTLTAGDILVL